MTTTKFPNGISIGKDGGKAVVAGTLAVAHGAFDPSSASQISLFTLPANAVVIDVISYGGATGGTNPTVKLGTSTDDDAFAVNIKADVSASSIASGTDGASVNALLSAETEVFGKVGTSAATGGSVAIAVMFTIADL